MKAEEVVKPLAEWARKLHGYYDNSDYTKGYNQAVEDIKKGFFEQIGALGCYNEY